MLEHILKIHPALNIALDIRIDSHFFQLPQITRRAFCILYWIYRWYA